TLSRTTSRMRAPIHVRLLFINANASPVYGGVERWMIDTARGLAARGHSTLLFGRPGSPWLVAATRAGLRGHGGIHGTWAARVLRIWTVMRAERPDLVIAKSKKLARMATWGRVETGARVALFLGATHELDRRRWLDRHTWRRVDAGIVVAHGAA